MSGREAGAMTDQDTDASLKKLIEQFQPRRIMAIGPAVKDLLSDYLATCPDCEIWYQSSAPSLSSLEMAHRFDLGVLSHTLEYLPRKQAIELLARLRDILCQRLIVVVPIGPDWPDHISHWEQEDLLGLGFTQVGEFEHAGRPVHIYAFDLAHYKTTPDWLNNRYWANPELFGKYWW
jgi:hypothetical protein